MAKATVQRVDAIPQLFEELGHRVGLGGALRWSRWGNLEGKPNPLITLGSGRARELRAFEGDLRKIVEVCAAAKRFARCTARDRARAAKLLSLVLEVVWRRSWDEYTR